MLSLTERIQNIRSNLSAVEEMNASPGHLSNQGKDKLFSNGPYYKWGAHEIIFKYFPKPNNMLPIELYNAEMSGTALWKTDKSFRQSVALWHEFVHVLQDISTGVGNWDFLQRRERNTLMMLNAAIMAPPNQSFYNCGKLLTREIITDQDLGIRYSPIFCDFDLFKEKFYSLISDRKIAGKPISPSMFNAIEPWRILEAEAVTSVYLRMRKIRMTDSQYKICKNWMNMWNPFEMPLEYRQLIMSLIYTDCGGDLKLMRSIIENRMDNLMYFYACLFDISLAHPSPKLAEKFQLHLGDMSPGVRACHINSLVNSNENRYKSIVARCGDAFIGLNKLIEEIEGSSYPSYEQIYEDWINQIRLDQPCEGGIWALRQRMATLRLENPPQFVGKNFSHFLTENIVLQFNVEGAEDGKSTLLYRFDSDEAKQVLWDIAWIRAMERLEDWLICGTPFRCPMTSYCEACTPRCKYGISGDLPFPRSDGCAVARHVEKFLDV